MAGPRTLSCHKMLPGAGRVLMSILSGQLRKGIWLLPFTENSRASFLTKAGSPCLWTQRSLAGLVLLLGLHPPSGCFQFETPPGGCADASMWAEGAGLGSSSHPFQGSYESRMIRRRAFKYDMDNTTISFNRPTAEGVTLMWDPPLFAMNIIG